MDVKQVWFRTINGQGAAQLPVEKADAAVTAVEQQAPGVVVEGPEVSFPPEPIHAFSAGHFRIQVTNQGNTVLNQVYLNTRFDLNYLYNICLKAPAKQRFYDNLNLEPGASVWLDFGDIEAEGQIVVPPQFCFWTSAPNNRPDTHHEDDAFCTAYTVTTLEPARLSGCIPTRFRVPRCGWNGQPMRNRPGIIRCSIWPDAGLAVERWTPAKTRPWCPSKGWLPDGIG